MIDVSIVIVCMNRPDNLRICLSSIKKYTSVSIETFVVAYLFSEENLRFVKEEYPWVNFIESNEIRGFSENNNLALKQAKGRYCFVLNDDTEMKMPVIDMLFKTIEQLPENIAIISPVTIYPDGRVQYCGRPRVNAKTKILSYFHLFNSRKDKKESNKKGIFQSYNIVGAAFMIKTDIFRRFGWFDEYYFFTPEDIALSTHLNNNGYECWVNEEVKLIHYEGMSGKNSISSVVVATKPAQAKGLMYFYAGEKAYGLLYITMCCFEFISNILRYVKYSFLKMRPNGVNAYSNMAKASLNTICSIFTRQTPKEIFIKYYQTIKK